MPPEPLYTPENLRQPAYQLRYTWCAWPAQNHFPDEPTQPFLEGLTAYWEHDGLRMLEYRWEPSRIQVTFSAKPHVSPVFLTRQAKGRLQHALRVSGRPTPFSRKVSLGTVGDNTNDDVESYIANQVVKEPVVDERFQEKLRQFTVVNPEVDLTSPTSTKRGRYWYNLHLVLIVEKRERLNDLNELATIRDRSLKLAAFHGYGLSRLALVPDHMHLALRGNVAHSPQEIALKFLNNTAYALGQCAVWEPCYYAGTFGAYNMNALRHKPV